MVKIYLLTFLVLSGTCLLGVGKNTDLLEHTNTEFHKFLPLIGIRINDGARFTNNTTVEVEIKSMKTPDNLIAEMQIGLNANLSDVKWQPYSTDKIKLQISPGDGEKTIYARLKDKAGNISPVESNKIVLDTKPPINCKLVLNKGEKYTNDKLGRVLLNAFAEEASEMMVSNFSDFNQAKWENYVRTKKWIIDLRGNGEKTVYAKFRDGAGNESEVVSTSIILDTTPPTAGSITVDNGDKFTNSRQVKLNIQCEDAIKVRIVDRNHAEIMDYKPEADGTMHVNWQLDSIQGPKTIRVYFLDEAENTSPAPKEATIIYKSSGPTPPKVIINNGQQFTNNQGGTVDLKIITRENPSNMTMKVSNEPTFAGAQKIDFKANIQEWKISMEKDGLKTVYVKLFDQAGNASETGSGEIILDRTPPKAEKFSINNGAQWTTSLKVTITSAVTDAVAMQISNNASMPPNTPWEKYLDMRPEWSLIPGDGVKTVYARFRDEAGNVSEISSANITLDTTPPSGGISINDGAKVTNDQGGIVKLSITFDGEAAGMQISNVPDFTDAKLQPLLNTISAWPLSEGDGPKTVFLRLQDKAGNFSKVYTANILLDRHSPTEIEMIINNGDEWVRNKNNKVALSFRAQGVVQMMVSNKSDFSDAEWIPYKTVIPWTLESGEGERTVYAKFKDPAGNVSEIISGKVISDYNPPVIKKFVINNDNAYCNDPQKKVNILIDVEGATMMAISNASIGDTSMARTLWEPYQSNKDWTLEGEDGIKTVYSRFKDEAGNVTPEYFDKIFLDRVPPADLKIAIDFGAKWFNKSDGLASVQLHASDADFVQLSNTNDFSASKWLPYQEQVKDYKLDISKSEATVYAKFKDKAGNESNITEARIQVDTEPPTNPKISIDDGAKYVMGRDRKIKINLGVENATVMRISRYENFRDVQWEPYGTSKEIVLAEPDGEKKYYAQFADDAGNLSTVVSASIILDTTPPEISSFTIDNGAEWTNNKEKKVLIQINADGPAEMMISNSMNFEGGKWEPYQPKLVDYELPGDDGEKTIYIRVRDEAGNISNVAHAKINLKRSF